MFIKRVESVEGVQTNKPTLKKLTNICFCKTVSPIFTLIKLCGFFPATWEHKEGKCTYTKSLLWTLYSIFIVFLTIVQIFILVDFINLTTLKSLPIMLNDITDAIYSFYVMILALLNFYRYPKWIKTINHLLKILKYNIFCKSARKQANLVIKGTLGLVIVVTMIRMVVLLWMYSSKLHDINIILKICLGKLLQSVPFVFYSQFVCMITVFIGSMACFEKLTISALNYKPVHPMKEIRETNNIRDFLGVINYEICKGDHPCTSELLQLQSAEALEFLRILHEDISLVIYDINDCMNPQFLFHTVIELTVLIIHWYAVVIYFAYDFKQPMVAPIHVINCMFVILHTLGLFLFLKNAQQLKNMINGLTNFLLEYSTRISSSEEHQQVRIFIEKLKQHRPFTANGVFTIDLGIAGPISANILTYVLVALQFNIPKE